MRLTNITNLFFILLVWLVLLFIPRVEAQTSRLPNQTKTERYPVYAPTLEENIRFRLELERRVNAEMLRALGMGEAAQEYENRMRAIQNLFLPNQKKGNENEDF